MKKATDISPYVRFTKQRDKGLEEYLLKNQQRISQILTGTFIEIEKLIRLMWPRVESNGYFFAMARSTATTLEEHCKMKLLSQLDPIASILIVQRKVVYSLSRAGETEALARALSKGAKTGSEFLDSLIKHLNQNLDTGGPIAARVELALTRLGNDIVDALMRARLQEMKLEEVIENVNNALPAVKRFKRVPNTLIDTKAMSEAFPISKLGVMIQPDEEETAHAIDGIDEGIWESLVEDYRANFLPKYRGPDSVFDIPDEHGDDYEMYGWEIEKEITHDFVKSVREGKIDAANENGIKDFIWVAVVDDRTDECCLWRDGLSTSEIEDKLNGERSGDECDSIVPPAHFNCRCDLAPASEDILDTPPPGEKYSSFEDWLENYGTK